LHLASIRIPYEQDTLVGVTATSTSWLLPSLQVFLLLGVFYLHLLRLLLMLLFHLLLLCLAGSALLRLLVLSFLLLHHFLVFLFLLLVKFVLLVLVLLIQLRVAGVGGLPALMRRKILSVNYSARVGRTRDIVFRPVSSSCFFRRFDPAVVKGSGFRCCRDRRFAMILRGS